ncbi:MAG: TusE/DsrC/DsvC family sulfur relay protein [Thermodesulfovibrionales bacterium]|nr:TusE/DsrC/DsvC family sulfur relay protein [Thermodesulfovibrionales bacterium]
MPAIECGGKIINVDDDGFLLNFDDWDENVACMIAEREGIQELTKERMDIIKFMREYYKHYISFPILGSVCKNIHQPKECVSEEFIDPLKAWKIAGLPRPGEEVVSYLRR